MPVAPPRFRRRPSHRAPPRDGVTPRAPSVTRRLKFPGSRARGLKSAPDVSTYVVSQHQSAPSGRPLASDSPAPTAMSARRRTTLLAFAGAALSIFGTACADGPTAPRSAPADAPQRAMALSATATLTTAKGLL
jgi:hypothetical protein